MYLPFRSSSTRHLCGLARIWDVLLLQGGCWSDCHLFCCSGVLQFSSSKSLCLGSVYRYDCRALPAGNFPLKLPRNQGDVDVNVDVDVDAVGGGGAERRAVIA